MFITRRNSVGSDVMFEQQIRVSNRLVIYPLGKKS
jgi:hypothetical protein